MEKLQFITHYTERYTYLDSVRLALAGGCRWIQLRMKDADDATLKATALEVQQLCRASGATFIIDDHVALAHEIQADGVHLGKQDMPIAEARNLLGKDYLIGGTANTFEDVCKHVQAGADYIGYGPYRFTTTKDKLSPLLGLEGYKHLIERMNKAGIQIPIIAIGGITPADIPALLDAGVHGIALSGAVLRADNPITEIKQILNILHP